MRIGCRGFACECAPRCFGLRPRWRLRLLRVRPRSRPCGFWAVSQEMGPDFAMGSGLLYGFWRELFAVNFSDLGKRRRWVAFRADSPCETAQKLQAGFACVKGTCLTCASVPVGAGRKHRDCRVACADVPSVSGGVEASGSVRDSEGLPSSGGSWALCCAKPRPCGRFRRANRQLSRLWCEMHLRFGI